MAGQGLAADKTGRLYGVSGNGSFNGTTDFGESVFKIRYRPATTTAAASLRITSWWAPYSDAARLGQDPTRSSPDLPADDKLAGVRRAFRADADAGERHAASPPLEGAREVMNTDENTGKPVKLVYPKVDGAGGADLRTRIWGPPAAL